MLDEGRVSQKEMISQLIQERKSIKNQFKQFKKDKLENFKVERKTTIQAIRKEQGKVPKEVQLEFKQKEKLLKEEIKEMEQETKQQIADINQQIKNIRKQKVTNEEKLEEELEEKLEEDLEEDLEDDVGEKLEEEPTIKEKTQETKVRRPYAKHLTPERKQNVKDGKKVLKKIMGTKLAGNTQFFARLHNEGISTTQCWPVWYKIHNQAIKELKEGTLTPQGIPQRLEELLVENGNPEKKAKQKAEHDARVEKNIQKQELEAINLGVEGYDFKCSLDEKRVNMLGNERTEVYSGFCFIKEDRLIIKKRSAFRKKDVGDKIIPYANINAIDYDKATGPHITSSIVISISGFDKIILKFITPENFQQLNEAWSNYNTKNTTNTPPQIIEKNNTSDADELLKYAQLYEKGLLTKEEFEFKKAEILGMNTNNSNSNHTKQKTDDYHENVSNIVSICPNCGNELEATSNFCSNCGFNLKK